MKIIVKGNPDKVKQTKKFVCNVCGCVFEADVGEYKIAFKRNIEVAYTKCPMCNSTTYETRE